MAARREPAGRAMDSRKRQPKYKLIADSLRDEIHSGGISAGDRLPSEHALMERFSVSRVTVRQALGELRQIGLVESRQGKGYFARQIKPVQDLQRLQGFEEMLAPYGVETHSKVIEHLEIPAGAEAAKALGIDEGAQIVRLARARIAGTTPVSLNISMFPLALGRRIVRLDVSRHDIFALMEERLEMQLGYADLTFAIVPIDERHAPHIDAEPGEQAICIRRLTHDLAGDPIDFERIYCRVDAMQFRAQPSRWKA